MNVGGGFASPTPEGVFSQDNMEPITVKEAQELMNERIRDRSGFGPSLQLTFEYAKMMSEGVEMTVEQLEEDLTGITTLDRKTLVQLIDLMPHNYEEARRYIPALRVSYKKKQKNKT